VSGKGLQSVFRFFIAVITDNYYKRPKDNISIYLSMFVLSLKAQHDRKSALKSKDPVLKPGLLIKFDKIIIEVAAPGLFYASRHLHNEYRKSPH